MKRIVLTLVLIVGILLTVGWSQQARATWEYKFEYKMNEKKANELGVQGWELAAIESTSSAGIANNVPVYVFKRAK
jgi:hypothetical protein